MTIVHRNISPTFIISSDTTFNPSISLSHSGSFHAPVQEHVEKWGLEPVQAERVLCGRVGEDHVWIIEHV